MKWKTLEELFKRKIILNYQCHIKSIKKNITNSDLDKGKPLQTLIPQNNNPNDPLGLATSEDSFRTMRLFLWILHGTNSFINVGT